MDVTKSAARLGWSLIELLISVAILVVLIGLTLSVVQKSRSSAARLRSLDILRQFGIALHQYAHETGGRIPNIDGDPEPVKVEKGGASAAYKLYPRVFTSLVHYVEPPPVQYQPYQHIKKYINPTDPTAQRAFSSQDMDCSYAANACLFRGRPRFESFCPDGLSSTIAFAERYSLCGKSSIWNHYASLTNNTVGFRRASFADGGSLSHGKNPGDVYAITEKNITRPSVPGVTFQQSPLRSECDFKQV